METLGINFYYMAKSVKIADENQVEATGGILIRLLLLLRYEDSGFLIWTGPMEEA